jgi:hypothetical protein
MKKKTSQTLITTDGNLEEASIQDERLNGIREEMTRVPKLYGPV